MSLTDTEGEVRELGAKDFANFKPISEFPELAGLARVRGKQVAPVKRVTTIRLDADIVECFKADGKGWQTRMNNVLREYVDKAQL